jgi:hypothetical protein
MSRNLDAVSKTRPFQSRTQKAQPLIIDTAWGSAMLHERNFGTLMQRNTFMHCLWFALVQEPEILVSGYVVAWPVISTCCVVCKIDLCHHGRAFAIMQLCFIHKMAESPKAVDWRTGCDYVISHQLSHVHLVTEHQVILEAPIRMPPNTAPPDCRLSREPLRSTRTRRN